MSRTRTQYALLLILAVLICETSTAAPRDIVALAMTVTLDTVSPAQAAVGRKAGDIDKLRVVFDAATIEPRTKRVKLLNFQHLTQGMYQPSRPDAHEMPVTDAWLDMAALPYRLHFRAAVTHGEAIVIEADAITRRLTIHRQDRPRDTEIGGPYVIDSKWLRSAAISRSGGLKIEPIEVHHLVPGRDESAHE